MGKYIITFEDNSEVEEDGVKYFRCTEVPWSYTSEIIISKLTPYTEPDTEQVREDAFKNGYDAACKDIDVKSKTNAAYRKGLEDAWHAARKIPLNVNEGGLSDNALTMIFGNKSIIQIFKEFSASEVVEKIRRYEQEQEEIKVGDEVICRNKTAVVTETTDKFTRVMFSNGSCYVLFSKELVKTGRHFTEIAEVLRKMQEEKE